MRKFNKIDRFVFIIIICALGSLTLTTQANAADSTSCLTSQQPTVANGKFLDHLAAVLLKLKLIRQTTYEEITQGDMRTKKNVLRRIFSRPQGRIDQYIKNADTQHQFIALTGSEKRAFLQSVSMQFSRREAGLLFTVSRFIFTEANTDKHFFVLEHAGKKSEYGVKLDRLAYNLAKAINDTTSEPTVLIPERKTVPVEHLGSKELQRWAKRRGLKEVTLVRFVTDYANEPGIKNTTSIESHIAFLLWLRDGDHLFSTRNAYWIKEQSTSILYDFDIALRQGSEEFDDFWNGDGRFIAGETIECLWKENLKKQYVRTTDSPLQFWGMVVKRKHQQAHYDLDYNAVRKYVRIIQSVPDSLIQRCVEDARFEMTQTDQNDLRYNLVGDITWKGLDIYDRLIKQRDSLADDINSLIKDLEGAEAQEAFKGEGLHLVAA